MERVEPPRCLPGLGHNDKMNPKGWTTMKRLATPVAVLLLLMGTQGCVGETETILPQRSLSWVEGTVTDAVGDPVQGAAVRPGEFAYDCGTGELASPPLDGLGATGALGDYFLEIRAPALVQRDLCVDLVVFPQGDNAEVFEGIAVVFTLPSDPVTTVVDLVYGADPGA